jgi:hypothetical protein
VRDALHPEAKRLFDVRRLARLAGVAGQMQTRSARRLEGRAVRAGRESHLVTREIEADHTLTGKRAGDLRERDVLLRRVLAHRADDGDGVDRARRQT